MVETFHHLLVIVLGRGQAKFMVHMVHTGHGAKLPSLRGQDLTSLGTSLMLPARAAVVRGLRFVK